MRSGGERLVVFETRRVWCSPLRVGCRLKLPFEVLGSTSGSAARALQVKQKLRESSRSPN